MKQAKDVISTEVLKEALHILDWIIAHHGDTINFEITDKVEENLAFWLHWENYDKIRLTLGYRFLLGILQYYEVHEDYERCGNILKELRGMNSTSFMRLPTHL